MVTTTTYKSLRGARGGLALWNDETLSDKMKFGVFPGVQGSVMLHIVAGKAACLGETLRPEFKLYNEAILDNARALALVLSDAQIRIVSGGTDTGLMLVDLSTRGVTGDVAASALEHAGLAVNKNLIPLIGARPKRHRGCASQATPEQRAVLEFQNSKLSGVGLIEFYEIRGTRGSTPLLVKKC